MNQERYPRGYEPKIAYWQMNLNRAIADGATEAAERCFAKVLYFMQRQDQVNNRISSLYE
jgi:hypothetical protein